MNFLPPRPVVPGSHLRLVAPSGPFDVESFEAGVRWLRERYEVSFREDIHDRCGYLAGTDERRLAELIEAISDTEVDAIVCARGGFGATRLLRGLDPVRVRQANKQIVGFSDITTLHSLWRMAGVRSVHAPMVAALGAASPAIRERWIGALEHPLSERSWQLDRIDGGGPGKAMGYLTGGNLAVLGAMLRTPYGQPPEGAVLFIEDVGERPYRVDRLLTSLGQAGWFESISGLVIGTFTEGEPGADGVTMHDVLQSHFAHAKFPVLSGMMSGHVVDNEPLPFGSRVGIDLNRLTLEDSGLRCLV